MKLFAIANDREETGSKAEQPSADYCPASDMPVLEDTDPTMPVLALTEEAKENFGYDPYDTGSFWAQK